MPIKVSCPGCKKAFNAPDAAAGRSTKCPACGGLITIPGAAPDQALPPQAAEPSQPVGPRNLPAEPSRVEKSVPAPYYEPPTRRRETPAEVLVEHHHKAKGGAFRSGFGVTFGCLLALITVAIGGCGVMILFGTALLGGGAAVVDNAVDAQREAALRAEQEREAERERLAQELAKITVSGARLSRDAESFSPAPTIELTVQNGTGRPIQRLSFHGKLQSEGRTLPWVEDDFVYVIPGGLEPGETQSWSLEPNFTSKFHNAETPEDATFYVEATDLEWAD